MNKKAALELSINAIVIVILAMTLLGLGLGFVRNMFKDIGDTTTKVQDQMKEQILDDLRRGDKKLSFPSASIDIEGGEEELVIIGVKNTKSTALKFQIQVKEVFDTSSYLVLSDSDLETSAKYPGTADTVDDNPNIPDDLEGKVKTYAYLWDSTEQTLSPGESNVYSLKLAADSSAAKTKLFKLIITDIPGTGSPTEYTSKTFFVKFI